jgi:tyrosyl-tRNA synthetase
MDKISMITEENIAECIDAQSLRKKLESGKKLNIKLGVDPTRPDLHLGHAITLRKLKQFQELGHNVIFLIGDATTKIGDPTGRDMTRPPLTDEQIKENTKTYLDQIGKIIDPEKCEIRYNSQWYSKMTFSGLIEILGKTTVAQVIEREDFKKRMSSGHDIGLHELIYPVMQGYDSVVLHADVELGGQDQKLNILMGRDLQKKYGQQPQDILIAPLLVGTDGVKKMSKSYDNYVGFNDSPSDKYGKIMSIPDSTIASYLELATNFSKEKIENMKLEIASKKINPMRIKEEIAFNIVEIYDGVDEAQKARENFENVFRKKEAPSEIPEISVGKDEINIIDALADFVEGIGTKSEASRLIAQGGVRVDGQIVEDKFMTLNLPVNIQVGKLKYVKLIK